ncbi:MAG: ABC transporter, substrate-binding protein (cluster 9, phospholipid) [Burkholderiaceae bacterium]|jgi:phospholipid/cholesterol/gamma-HCH transport system substrate-binding protein|nr:MAG: ABC transporter, substrate-binding protein (cluster 9, phospholipid) [Burkholderiaceae bacterium]
MENKAHALAAGAFVLLVTALLIALAAWLMRDTQVVRVYEISTREPLNGLQLQAPVRFRGINVGKVSYIGFDPNVKGNALLRLAVDEDAPVTQSTYATLNFQGVTGLAFVQLDDTGKSTEPIPRVYGGGYPRIPLRPSLLSSLSDEGASMIREVAETSKRVNRLFAPENQQALIAAIDGLGRAADAMTRLANGLDHTVTERLDPALAGLPALVAGSRQAMASLDATAGAFDRVAQRLGEKNGALDQLADGTRALNQAAATLNNATLPRVGRASDEVSRTARQFDRTVRVIGDNPQSLLVGNGAVPPGPGEPGFVAPGAAR